MGPEFALGGERYLKLDGVLLPRKDRGHSLGGVLDPALLLDKLVECGGGTFHQLSWVYQLWAFLE